MAILFPLDPMHGTEQHSLAEADLASLLAQIFVEEHQKVVGRKSMLPLAGLPLSNQTVQ